LCSAVPPVFCSSFAFQQQVHACLFPLFFSSLETPVYHLAASWPRPWFWVSFSFVLTPIHKRNQAGLYFPGDRLRRQKLESPSHGLPCFSLQNMRLRYRLNRVPSLSFHRPPARTVMAYRSHTLASLLSSPSSSYTITVRLPANLQVSFVNQPSTRYCPSQPQ